MPFGTVRPSSRIRELNRFVTVLCLIVMITALTGCGLLPFGDKEESRSPAPPPPSQTVTQIPEEPMDSGGMIAPAPQTAASPPPDGPQGYEQVPPPPPPVPLDPVLAAGPLTLGPDGTMGSLGLNLEGYFDDTADAPERLTRIERTVMALHRDMKTLSVPIQRLITVERDISALITQLGELTQAPPPNAVPVMAYSGTPPPMATSPPAGTGGSGITPATTAANAQAPPPASGGYTPSGATGPATVNRLRVGEHADKTRIVLDVSAATPYRYDLDNGEMLLVIELGSAGWADKKEGTFGKKSPLLASYAVHATETGGSRLVIQLRKGTSVAYETAIKPNGNSNYRIVIDLKK